MGENSTFKFFSLLSLSFLTTPSPYLSLALTGIIIIHECQTQPSVKSRATFAPFPSPAVTGICVGRIVLSTNKEKKCRYPACGYAERGLTSHCQKKWRSMYVCLN
ncbi:hypothetical protein BKA57DRAFT_455453 [Linnemannia elongata]|nr:hypothetical protein BKA57DRAFT_455453 [Linnemannia elongata]